MPAPRRPLVALQGGKPAGAPPGRPLAAGRLRALPGGAAPADLVDALAEAVYAAREMRLEIERRIARALATLHDRQ